MADNIPGTRVPDTPIHRASMWLEDIKFGERRADVTDPEPMGDEAGITWQRFVDEAEANFTVEQLREAAEYYGTNMLAMTVGGRIDFVISSPAGPLDARAIFCSLWLDAFMHGFATARARTGLSNHEIAEQRHGH